MNPAAENCCSSTLIVTGADLDPDAVTEMLDLTPTQTWRQGEHKRFELPDGAVRQFDSFHEFGGWKCSFWNGHRDASLHEQINHAIEILTSRASALAKLRADGFDVELNCADGSPGSSYLPLEHHVLKQIVELSLDLDITLYR